MISPIPPARRAQLQSWAPVMLAWGCLALLPFGRLVEAPVIAMAIGGVYCVATRRGALLASSSTRLFVVVFALAWVPMVLSLPGALNPSKSLEVVLNHLRFLLGGVFLTVALSDDRAHARLLRLSAWWIGFWLLDACVQHFAGEDLFGIEAMPGRLGAMFGPGNSKFGLTLAALCPLLWEHSRRHWPRWVTSAVVLATWAVVVAGGARSAWIVLAAVSAAYVLVLLAWRGRLRLALAAGVAALALAAATYSLSDRVSGGVRDAVRGLTGDAPATSNSVAHRLVIWRAALNTIEDNPINGVGARGFRYGYTRYTTPDDPFLRWNPPEIATHTHQLLLEVTAETGAIGLAGLIAYLVVLTRAFRRAPPGAARRMLPYGIAIAGAYFPLNSHLALYSAYWSQICWWLIALYCAACFTQRRERQPPGPSRAPAFSAAPPQRDR